VFGVGSADADLMVIGEAPGAEEDRRGEPFVGRSGALLDRLMAEVMDRDRTSCYIANVVKCRPPQNRNPSPVEIRTCRPYLDQQIEMVAPDVIITLGNFSSRLLLGTTDGIMKLRGRAYGFAGASLVPTLHPAAALRGGAAKMDLMRSDLALANTLLEAR